MQPRKQERRFHPQQQGVQQTSTVQYRVRRRLVWCKQGPGKSSIAGMQQPGKKQGSQRKQNGRRHAANNVSNPARQRASAGCLRPTRCCCSNHPKVSLGQHAPAAAAAGGVCLLPGRRVCLRELDQLWRRVCARQWRLRVCHVLVAAALV